MPTFKYPVALAWTGSGSPGVNVWHFRSEDNADPLETDVQEIIDGIETFYTAVKGVFPADLVVTGPDEAIKDPYGAPEYREVDGFTVQGTGTQGYAPLASAIVAGWRTTSATRSGRGRTFLGPLALYCVDADGTPKSDVLAIVRNAAAALVATSRDWTQGSLGVYSQTDGVLRDFQSSAVRDTFAVLRSRRD